MPLGVSLHIGLNSVDPGHYQGWSGPLVACEADARDMSAIAAGSGFKPEIVLTRSATRAVVEERIAAAAGSCAAGDIFLLTYSGHGGQVPDLNGDEADGRDETWCLFDGQLIDDEIYHALSAFSPGVRILVLSDSCHSGSITKNLAVMESLKGESTSDSYRAMPTDLCFAVYEAHKAFYQPILLDPTLVDARSTIKASALLISGCQDNQLSRDGPFNGAFTGALKRVLERRQVPGRLQRFPPIHPAAAADRSIAEFLLGGQGRSAFSSATALHGGSRQQRRGHSSSRPEGGINERLLGHCADQGLGSDQRGEPVDVLPEPRSGHGAGDQDRKLEQRRERLFRVGLGEYGPAWNERHGHGYLHSLRFAVRDLAVRWCRRPPRAPGRS